MPQHVITLRRWQVGLAFFAVAVSFTAGAWIFTGYNGDRIRDIQRNRVESCRLTYEGVRQVFRPFFRPVRVRTPKERHDIRKFNRRVDDLKADCDLQVGASP